MKKRISIFLALTLVLAFAGAVAASAKTEVTPASQKNIPYEMHDFQGYSDGGLLTAPVGSANPFRNHWTPKTSDANASKVIDDGDGEMSLYLDARSAAFHDHRYEAGYTFLCDFMNGETDNKNFSGFLFNWGEENNKTDTGFITNNGIRADGEDAMVGYSGCGFKLLDGTKDTLRFFIYTMDKELGVIEADIKTRTDFGSSFLCLQVVDTTSELVFFADDDWICTISFSGDDVLPDEPEYAAYSERYYRNAQITDSEGNVVATTDKALISKTGSIAIVSYDEPMFVDNIAVQTTDEDFELPTPKPKATATPEVTATPVPPAETEAPATAAQDPTAEPKDDDKGCGGTLTFGVGAMLAAGMALMFKRKEN